MRFENPIRIHPHPIYVYQWFLPEKSQFFRQNLLWIYENFKKQLSLNSPGFKPVLVEVWGIQIGEWKLPGVFSRAPALNTWFNGKMVFQCKKNTFSISMTVGREESYILLIIQKCGPATPTKTVELWKHVPSVLAKCCVNNFLSVPQDYLYQLYPWSPRLLKEESLNNSRIQTLTRNHVFVSGSKAIYSQYTPLKFNMEPQT